MTNLNVSETVNFLYPNSGNDVYFIQYHAKCVSGCVCPAGLVADGKGGCIKEDNCPCVHNEATYQPGEQIKMKCNTWYEKRMLVCKVNFIQY